MYLLSSAGVPSLSSVVVVWCGVEKMPAHSRVEEEEEEKEGSGVANEGRMVAAAWSVEQRVSDDMRSTN